MHHLCLQEVDKELLEDRICNDVWEMDHLFRGPHHVRRWEIRYDRGHVGCVGNGEKEGEGREGGVGGEGGVSKGVEGESSTTKNPTRANDFPETEKNTGLTFLPQNRTKRKKERKKKDTKKGTPQKRRSRKVRKSRPKKKRRREKRGDDVSIFRDNDVIIDKSL